MGTLFKVFIVFLIAANAKALENESDPFSDVVANETLPAWQIETTKSDFFSDNFGFRKELMSEVGANTSDSASRQSLGFEVIKKFSSPTKTYASFDFQARLVRRDGFVDFPNDMEGMNREKWFGEYHNAYFDFYNVIDPLLDSDQQSNHMGKFNGRIGRFYVPFGLNLQTDTHGPLLQLSNERNFGFERDWYGGLWGNINQDVRYDLYYLVGSGYDLKYNGQKGLGAGRISLANKYSYDYGLEGGLSFLSGERLVENVVVNTTRGGVDGRYRHPIHSGLITWTSELSAGEDSPHQVKTQLHQLDYLTSSRKIGLSAQGQWFWQEKPDSRLLTEATWYFSNDIAGSNLHWIKLNNQIDIQKQEGDKNVLWTLQYYRYW